MVDSARLWSRALPAAEIQNRLTAFHPTNRDDLLAELLFDEISGNTLLDSSGNSLHAHIGTSWAVERIHANSIRMDGGDPQPFIVPVASQDFRSTPALMITPHIDDWEVSGFSYNWGLGGYQLPSNTVVNVRSKEPARSWQATVTLLNTAATSILPNRSVDFDIAVSAPQIASFTASPEIVRSGWTSETTIKATLEQPFKQTLEIALQRETANGWVTEATTTLHRGWDSLDFFFRIPRIFHDQRTIHHYRLMPLNRAYSFADNSLSIEFLPDIETVSVTATRRGQPFPIQALNVFSGASTNAQQLAVGSGWELRDLSPNFAQYFITPQQQHTTFIPSQFILLTEPLSSPQPVVFRVLEPQLVTTDPLSVIDGGTVQVITFQLDRISPFGGTDIFITSSHPSLILPAIVTVPAGASTLQFNVRADTVEELTEVEWFAVVDTQEVAFRTWIAPQPRTLSGWAMDEDRPFAGTTVLLSGPDGIQRSTVTDANGGFSFNQLIDGEYTISLAANALNWEQNSFSVTVGDELVQAIQFLSRYPMVTGISWPEGVEPFEIEEGESLVITLHFDEAAPAQGSSAALSTLPAGGLQFMPANWAYLAPGETTATLTVVGGICSGFCQRHAARDNPRGDT
ncbi:MAG: carboxypeptidase-like regulatory domain-containing protein [Verrucomicrobia bacterium]|nr:carboxypeptidase-like regulatory domain-containing protein [Verrucomicrobiota bacterium]